MELNRYNGFLDFSRLPICTNFRVRQSLTKKEDRLAKPDKSLKHTESGVKKTQKGASHRVCVE